MIHADNIAKVFRKNGKEVRALDGVSLDVESGQAHPDADDVQERHRPPHAIQRPQSPLVGQHRRRHAEGDHVGQRVELNAEVGGGVSQPGQPAVEAVQDGREDDQHHPV